MNIMVMCVVYIYISFLYALRDELLRCVALKNKLIHNLQSSIDVVVFCCTAVFFVIVYAGVVYIAVFACPVYL